MSHKTVNHFHLSLYETVNQLQTVSPETLIHRYPSFTMDGSVEALRCLVSLKGLNGAAEVVETEPHVLLGHMVEDLEMLRVVRLPRYIYCIIRTYTAATNYKRKKEEKKVDERVATLIQNGVKASHHSFLFIVGHKSRDQIVSLHYMLRMESVSRANNANVLWCYKDNLELSRSIEHENMEIDL
ncbi:RNA cytidine acetyltransferase 1-like protein [Tanacetum coccineum]